MSPDRLREFYELCQAYRHTPIEKFVQVNEAYQELVDFVNLLVGEKSRNVPQPCPECSTDKLDVIHMDLACSEAQDDDKGKR